MKICIIENIYPPYDRGGAEQVVAKTVQGLIDGGHEVVLITSSPRGDEFQEEGKLKIYRKKPRNIYFYTEGHRYPHGIRLLWHIIGIFNTGIAQWTREILEKEKPDVVHTHNLMGLSFLIPRVIRSLELRHVHTVHDVQLVEPSAMILKAKENSWRYTGFPSKIYTWLMKKLVGSPDVVISPSRFLLDFYRDRGFFAHSACDVLRNPITFDLPAPTRERIAQEDGTCHILYLGQIEHHKGVLLLAKAFTALSENIPNVHLHIAGAGSMTDELGKALAANDRVTIYGRVDRKKIPVLFAKSDVTVVPSLCYENSPTVIFESLYFGVPVVASRIEGVAELIEEEVNGLTFEAGNEGALVTKLKWCVEHKDELQQMSTKTTQSLIGLSLATYIEKITNLYRS